MRILLSICLVASLSQAAVNYTVDWSADISWLATSTPSSYHWLTFDLLYSDAGDAESIVVSGVGENSTPVLALLDLNGNVLNFTNLNINIGNYDSFYFTGQVLDNAFICDHKIYENGGFVYDTYGVEIEGDSFGYNKLFHFTYADHNFKSFGCSENKIYPEKGSKVILTPENRLEKYTFFTGSTPNPTNDLSSTAIVLSVLQTDNLPADNWKIIGSIEDSQSSSNSFYRLEISK